MDEKTLNPGGVPPSSSASQSRSEREGSSKMWTRSLRLAILGLLALFFILAHTRLVLEPQTDSDGRLIRPGVISSEEQKSIEVEDVKVPMSIHIMSRCPDALDCLSELVVPAMAKTADKVNLTVAYIGTVTSPGDDIACKHGPGECLGNIIELCAAHLYPEPKQYLGFTYCMTREYDKVPDRSLVHNCALESGMSFEDLNDCASKDDGAFGMGLLRDSVWYSGSVNASISCTVRLDGKERCIRDGGEWKDCTGGSEVDDLVGDITKLWNSKNGKGEEL